VTIAAPQPPGSPPAAATDQLASRRTGLIWGSLALGLVLLLTVVWALGGFEHRGDRIVPVTVGTTLEVGPYELTFTSATAQRVTAADNYEVVVQGTGRTTKDETIAPTTGDSGFIVAKNPANSEIQTVESFHYGDGTDVTLRAKSFTPGLEPIRFTATFDYTQPVRDSLLLVVFDQDFFDNNIFSDDEPTWNRVDTGYSMKLPVQVLPERDY
jgi:hypothetical protein